MKTQVHGLIYSLKLHTYSGGKASRSSEASAASASCARATADPARRPQRSYQARSGMAGWKAQGQAAKSSKSSKPKFEKLLGYKPWSYVKPWQSWILVVLFHKFSPLSSDLPRWTGSWSKHHPWFASCPGIPLPARTWADGSDRPWWKIGSFWEWPGPSVRSLTNCTTIWSHQSQTHSV